MKNLIIALSLIISGCGINFSGQPWGNQRWETLNDRMAAKVGLTEQELINDWDVPEKSYRMDNGAKVFSYDVCSTGAYYTISNACTGYICKAKFLIENGVVTKWGQNAANNCKVYRGVKRSRDTPIPTPTM